MGVGFILGGVLLEKMSELILSSGRFLFDDREICLLDFIGGEESVHPGESF